MKQLVAKVEEHAEGFAALGHPARIVILRALLQSHPEGLISSEIQEAAAIPASTLSFHLDAMRVAGLIEMEKQGRTRRYRAACDRLSMMLRFLFDECCTKSGAIAAESCTSGENCC